MTIDQMASLVGEVGRRLVERQKMETMGYFLALTSLFDKGQPIKRYFAELDAGLKEATEMAGGENGDTDSGNGQPEIPKQYRRRVLSEQERQESVRRTLRELSKLNVLMDRPRSRKKK